MNNITTIARPGQFSLKQLLWLTAIVSALLAAVVVFGLRGVLASLLVLSVWTIYYARRRRNGWLLFAGVMFTVAMAHGLYVAVLIHTVSGGVGPIRSSRDYPFELADMIKATGAGYDNIRVEKLGGFIDSEYAWRIDLSSAQRDQVVADLGLVTVASGNVPREFFGAFPRGWRPQHTADSQCFGTPGFTANGRGADGEYYFVMYDARLGQMYVWLKRNF